MLKQTNNLSSCEKTQIQNLARSVPSGRSASVRLKLWMLLSCLTKQVVCSSRVSVLPGHLDVFAPYREYSG